MVGDDGQGLQRGLGKPARLGALLDHQVLEVGGGLEAPAPSDLGQFHAAAGIEPQQLAQGGVHIDVGRQAPGEVLFAQGARGGEQQRLDHPSIGGGIVHDFLSDREREGPIAPAMGG